MAKTKVLTHNVSKIRLSLEDLKRLLASNVEDRVKIQKIETICKGLYETPSVVVPKKSTVTDVPKDLVTHTEIVEK